MLPVISALLACMAGFFRSRTALYLEHLALRHQLAVYQRSVPRPHLHATDRLFWAWLSRPWSGWQRPLAFVQPRTVIAWQRQRFRDHWRRFSQRGTPGRPTLAKEIRDLIRTMGQANPTWGAPRIVGELRKLGIDVAKSTVEKYRVRPRTPSSPTWKTFLANHVQDLDDMCVHRLVDSCDGFSGPTGVELRVGATPRSCLGCCGVLGPAPVRRTYWPTGVFASPSHTSVGRFAINVGPSRRVFAPITGPYLPVFASLRYPVRKPQHLAFICIHLAFICTHCPNSLEQTSPLGLARQLTLLGCICLHSGRL